MPSIPIPSLPGVASAPSSSVMLDANALSAGTRGAQQFGVGLADAAQSIGSIEQDIQAHINVGILAKEDIERAATAEKVKKFMVANQGNPDSWPGYKQQAWQAYQDGRSARMAGDPSAGVKPWGGAVVQSDTIANNDFISKANVIFDANHQQAKIAESNGYSYQQALDAAKVGLDPKPYLNQMDAAPEEKLKMAEQLSRTVAKMAVDQQIEADPPQALKDLADPAKFPLLDPEERRIAVINASKAQAEGARSIRAGLLNAVADGETPTGDALTAARAQWEHYGLPLKVFDKATTVQKPNDTPAAFRDFSARLALLPPDMGHDDDATAQERFTLGQMSTWFSGPNGTVAKERFEALAKPAAEKKQPSLLDTETGKYVRGQIDATGKAMLRLGEDGQPLETGKQPTQAERNAVGAKLAPALDDFESWLKANSKMNDGQGPDRTQAQKWWGNWQANHVSNDDVANAFGLPISATAKPAASAPAPISPADAAKLPSGTRFYGTDNLWHTRK